MVYFTKSMLSEIYDAKRNSTMFSSSKSISDYDSFDIFIAHSYDDRKYIRKLKDKLENEYHFTCYVDWITEPSNLDRGRVSPETANLLRKRMKQSNSLIFCKSDNSPESKWMPWELGYFDAHKGRVAILPILDEGNSFNGQEYLGLYPFIDFYGSSLFVNGIDSKFIHYQNWLKGELPYKH